MNTIFVFLLQFSLCFTLIKVKVKSSEPRYVFYIPGENRTLVFTKRDFLTPVYPNVSSIYKKEENNVGDKKKTKDLQLSSSRIKENFKKYTNELSDNNVEKVVEENVRTERTFIEFLNTMNQDLKITKKKIPTNAKTTHVKDQKKASWNDFGLEGWSGNLATVKNSNHLKK